MTRKVLDDCCDFCERLTKRTAGNFYYAFLGLPAAQYRAMCVLYAFMRVTDDWGDAQHLPATQRAANLNAWRRSLIQVLAPEWTEADMGGWTEAARFVLPAMCDVAARFAIPHEHLFAVIQGVESDLTREMSNFKSQISNLKTENPNWKSEISILKTEISNLKSDVGRRTPETSNLKSEISNLKSEIAVAESSMARPESCACRFETFEQLADYCYLVAGAVGLCCIHIWGFHGEEAIRRAIDCGTAFQLTNILRDVGEDAQARRVYLPAEDLRRFGVSVADLQSQNCDDPFRALMAFEAERARSFYASAELLLPCLEPHGRPILKAMLQLYGGLLREIVRQDFDVFNRHVSLPRWRKLWIAADALVQQQWLAVSR